MANFTGLNDTEMTVADSDGKILSSRESAIMEPKCFVRHCSRFSGELNGKPVCMAFPSGIPDSIAYGDDEHLAPVEGDNGFLFDEVLSS